MAYLLLSAAAIALLGAAGVRGFTAAWVRAFLATAAAITIGDHLFTEAVPLYSFRPGLLSEPRADDLLGAMLADSLFVPAVVAAVATWPPVRWRPALNAVTAAGFVAMEVLFVRAGIFVQHGWEYWYTAVLFPLYLWGLHLWLGWSERNPYSVPGSRWITIGAAFILAVHVWGHVSTGILHLTGPAVQSRGPLPVAPDHLHSLVVLVPAAAFAIFGWARFARGAALLAGGAWLAHLWLQAEGLRWYRAPWSPEAAAVTLAIMIYGVGLIDTWLAGEQNAQPLRG